MLKILSILLLLCGSWAQAADLAWNASVVDEQHAAPDGYRIHWGASPGVYTGQADAGLALTWHIPDDWFGSFYFAASAYNSGGSSGYSNEVLFTRDQPQQHIGATGLRASRYQVGDQQMAIEYFGYTTLGNTDYNSSAPYALWARYACPGSGDMTVKEMSVYAKIRSGGVNVRMAVYSSDGATKICEGTAEVALTSSYGWRGHLDQSSISPNPCNLTGGTQYLIAISHDAPIDYHYDGDLTGDTYASADYTGGFPSSINPGNFNYWGDMCKRVGVEASGGSSAVPVIMRSYRARRN